MSDVSIFICPVCEAIIEGDQPCPNGPHAVPPWPVMRSCGPCAGTGEYPPTGGDDCSFCGGEGEVIDLGPCHVTECDNPAIGGEIGEGGDLLLCAVHIGRSGGPDAT